MDQKQFLSRSNLGVLLRVFATKEDQVLQRVKMVEYAVARIRAVTLKGIQPVRRIDVLVWADKNYVGQSDCGAMAPTLRSYLNCEKGVHIHEVQHGDLFCGLLNYGIARQSRAGVDYSIVLSPDAFSYYNEETLEVLVEAASNRALAVGVAISELTESILQGRIANTFAMWHNISLLTVGGFDMRASKPANDQLAHYMCGWSPEKGQVFYQLAGVEEVIPLARLVQTFGPCIAPVKPMGSGVKHYIIPDPQKEPELWLRHMSKMGTKLERQSALLASVGCDITFLQGGVMPEYRKI